MNPQQKFKGQICLKQQEFTEKFSYLGYSFVFGRFSGDWGTIFVHLPGRLSIGKIVFKRNGGKAEIYNVKSYKPFDYPYSDEDKIWYLLSYYLDTGKDLRVDRFNEMVVKAREEREEDLRKKQERRERLRSKKRKRLSGKNIRNILNRMIYEITRE